MLAGNGPCSRVGSIEAWASRAAMDVITTMTTSKTTARLMAQPQLGADDADVDNDIRTIFL